MNLVHHWLCGSARWRRALEEEVLPWVLDGLPLGDNLLELGPGPGLTTDLLRSRGPRITAIEIDARLAHRLAARLAGSNVRVIRGDATTIPCAGGTFTSAASLTMLHHVSTAPLQDRLFREVHRVLQPGSFFFGTDGTASWGMKLLHIHDTLTTIDPRTLPARLKSAGFSDVDIELKPGRFRFRARK